MFKFFNFNKIIKILILSDISLLTGLGFIAPIFAIFLTTNIEGGNVQVAGFAASIFWIVECLAIIPIGKYLDRNHGEKDDLLFIVIGNFLTVLAILGYIFADLPWHIYFLQIIYALGMSMNIPGYTAIFTRHIDKGKEAFSWSARGALVAVGSGVGGALGGIVAHNFGFNNLFIGVIIFILLSSALPLLLYKDISVKNKKMPKVPETKIVQLPK
ncbi:MFS transporter [Candidatus Wolfebacteria bacterium]|nr:MFS transporter [Candidatus Wolfebacteria bacterium]